MTLITPHSQEVRGFGGSQIHHSRAQGEKRENRPDMQREIERECVYVCVRERSVCVCLRETERQRQKSSLGVRE